MDIPPSSSSDSSSSYSEEETSESDQIPSPVERSPAIQNEASEEMEIDHDDTSQNIYLPTWDSSYSSISPQATDSASAHFSEEDQTDSDSSGSSSVFRLNTSSTATKPHSEPPEVIYISSDSSGPESSDGQSVYIVSESEEEIVECIQEPIIIDCITPETTTEDDESSAEESDLPEVPTLNPRPIAPGWNLPTLSNRSWAYPYPDYKKESSLDLPNSQESQVKCQESQVKCQEIEPAQLSTETNNVSQPESPARYGCADFDVTYFEETRLDTQIMEEDADWQQNSWIQDMIDEPDTESWYRELGLEEEEEEEEGFDIDAFIAEKASSPSISSPQSPSPTTRTSRYDLSDRTSEMNNTTHNNKIPSGKHKELYQERKNVSNLLEEEISSTNYMLGEWLEELCGINAGNQDQNQCQNNRSNLNSPFELDKFLEEWLKMSSEKKERVRKNVRRFHEVDSELLRARISTSYGGRN